MFKWKGTPFNLVKDDGTLFSVLVNVASCTTPPWWVFQTHLIYPLWFFNPFNSFFYYSTHFSEFGTTVSFRMNHRFFSMLLVFPCFFHGIYVYHIHQFMYHIFMHTHTHTHTHTYIYMYIYIHQFDRFSLIQSMLCHPCSSKYSLMCVFSTRASIETLYPVGTLDYSYRLSLSNSAHFIAT